MTGGKKKDMDSQVIGCAGCVIQTIYCLGILALLGVWIGCVIFLDWSRYGWHVLGGVSFLVFGLFLWEYIRKNKPDK